jgi:site-specific DNA-adenine methylase
MFSYYGSKAQIIEYYPSPKYPLIIEPFCGAAHYAQKYFNHDVWLNDIYTAIYDIWCYLQRVDEDEILDLPLLKSGDDLRDFDLTDEQRLLLGFCVQRGTSTPNHIVSGYGASENRSNTCWDIARKRILQYLPVIRRWKITNFDYTRLPNLEATWFIDPPYKTGGASYVHNTINYNDLADWCKSRNGQVIVCENGESNWLPFVPLCRRQGSTNSNKMEMIWTSDNDNCNLHTLLRTL